jgi:FkbM family methyltransferase
MNLPSKIDVFKKYNQLHLPRPQPSDFAVDYFQEKENGFFVDIGAAEGILCNNSLPFEEGYGWKGICVEANPVTYQKLIKNRPWTLNLNMGVADKEDTLEFWQIQGEAACLSGFEKFMSEEHKRRIRHDVAANGDLLTKIDITCVPFDYIAKSAPNLRIDYLSIDTEGADLSIVQNINFSKIDIELISVEADHSFDQIKEILQQNRYMYIGACCNDKFFSKI